MNERKRMIDQRSASAQANHGVNARPKPKSGKGLTLKSSGR